MWSTQLIIGVAVAASLFTTFTGIILAVAIERRRYRKYIRRHTAGTAVDDQDDLRQTIDQCSCKVHTPISSQLPTVRSSSETWVTWPQSDVSNHDSNTHASSSPPLRQKPGAKKNIHKTLNGPIKKKRTSRKRLRRPPPHRSSTASRLPAITEHSDGSQESLGFALRVEKKVTAKNPGESEHGGSIDLSSSDLTTTYVTSVMSHTGIEPFGRINNLGLTTGTASNGRLDAAAPRSPLPAVPHAHLQKDEYLSMRHASIASIDSIGSSVLDLHSPVPHKSAMIQEKTQSKVFQEFDFDLPETQRRRSPLHQMVSVRDSGSEERTSTEPKHRSSLPAIESRSALGTHTSGRSSHVETARNSTKDFTVGPVGRHSMCDNGRLLKNWQKSRLPVLSRDKSDPFISDLPQRPFSLIERVPLRDLEPIASAPLTMLQYPRYTSSKLRSDVTQTDRWPVLVPAATAERQRLSPDPEKALPTQGISTFSGVQFAMNSVGGRRETGSPRPRRVSSYNNMRAPHAVSSGRIDSGCPSPSTPLSTTIQKWRFDLPPDTPTLFPPASPDRSYNSPILPPPAYMSQQLYSRPRQSQVRGPRSPPGSRGQSRSPLRKHKSILQVGKPGNTLRAERYESSTDLRRSVMLLRSLNSEGHLLSSEQDLAYHRLGSVGKELSATSKHVPSKQNVTTMSSTITTSTPTILVKPSMASLRSIESDSGVSSIWEDASIHEDAPELDSRALTPTQGTARSTVEALQVFRGTPKTYTKDLEADENVAGTLAKIRHSTHVKLDRSQSSVRTVRGVGSRTAVPDTPGSMYDASGFLKE